MATNSTILKLEVLNTHNRPHNRTASISKYSHSHNMSDEFAHRDSKGLVPIDPKLRPQGYPRPQDEAKEREHYFKLVSDCVNDHIPTTTS